MAEYEACILVLQLAADMDVQDVLVLGDSDLLVHQIQGEWETRDLKLIPYRQCLHDLSKRFRSMEFRHIPQVHNEVANALATLESMLHHPDRIHVDLLHIQVRDQHAYCNMINEEMDGEPWFYDVKEYLRMGVYPEQATGDQKRAIRRLGKEMLLTAGRHGHKEDYQTEIPPLGKMEDNTSFEGSRIPRSLREKAIQVLKKAILEEAR
ncbi:uncharacterized protein [Nicotiana sylvestris]|uniref:uncharacterized protein n=1 Tax=Nicotiana sylvestris TaxID=4096 RepID=UPI00388C8B0F